MGPCAVCRRVRWGGLSAEEGLDQVFARHARFAEATRRAVRVWRGNNGPEIYGTDPHTQSNSVTTVLFIGPPRVMT